MKTKTTLLSLLFSFLNSVFIFAQGSTLNLGSAPSLGDVFTFYTHSTSGVAIGGGATGAAQTWDYSALTSSSTTVTESYVVPSTVDAQACGSLNLGCSAVPPFSNATMAVFDGGKASYYILNGNNLIMLGYITVMGGVTMPYSNSGQILITYPFQYGSSLTDIWTVYKSSGISPDERAHSTTVADGYGTLKLPGVIYSDVLRVKYRDIDSNLLDNTLIWDHITYDWYDGVHKQPVLRIVENAETGTITKVLTFASGPNVGAGNNAVSGLSSPESQFKIYPSPANEKTTLVYAVAETNSEVTISFYSVLGAKVKTENRQNLNAGTYTEEVDVRGLAKGMYIVDLNINNDSYKSKLIVE